MSMQGRKKSILFITLLSVMCIAIFGILDFAVTRNSIKQYKDSIVIGNYIGFALFIVTTIFLLYVFSLIIEKMIMDKENILDAYAPEVKKQGKILFLSGEYRGTVLDVDEKGIVIGRDANQCNLILDACNVSRKHCSIKFESEESQYMITDFSTFGTFISYEGRLKKGCAKSVYPGCKVGIKMGNGCFEMQLM